MHGCKAHVGADADTALVEQLSVTPANVHDGREGPSKLPEAPGDVFADSASGGQHIAAAVRAKGGVPRVAITGMWGRGEAEPLVRIQAWNGPIQRVRARIERIFGTWKRCYGLRCMRWPGRARATAHNIKRSFHLQPA